MNFPHCSNHCSNPFVIKLKKNVSQAMGMTLRKDKVGRCIIARIMIGGLIHRQGSLHVGDEIIEINSESVQGDNVEVIQRLLKTAHGFVYITVKPNNWRDPQNCEIYVRAMYEYNPSEDVLLPSSQIGLSFAVGDILRIISKDDSSWWQAQHLDCDVDTPARLIPSGELQESRAVSFLSLKIQKSLLALDLSKNNQLQSLASTACTSSCNPFILLQKRRHKRLLKAISRKKNPIDCNGGNMNCESIYNNNNKITNNNNMHPPYNINNYSYHPHPNVSFITNQQSYNPLVPPTTNLTQQQQQTSTTANTSNKISNQLHLFLSDLEFSPYEEVVEIAEHPRKSLILLGAHGVGRRHIKNCLVETYPKLFAAPIPHTSQTLLPSHVHGKDYYFTSQEEMLTDIANNQYLEYGKQDDILYGIKLETVKTIINSNVVPVLDVEPQTLRLLRNGEFSPFVVFVSPPDLEMMSDSIKEISDNRLEKLIEESELLESVYRPYIDMEIVNYSIEETVEPIIKCLRELQSNPQWIPVTWIY